MTQESTSGADKINGTIAMVGAGNMGEALIKGLLSSGAVAADQIVASDRRDSQRELIARRYQVATFSENTKAVAEADVVILAVKPQIIDKVMDEIRPALKADVLVLSIAAGVDLESMESRLDASTRVVRAMPNVACLVGHGATGLAGGKTATEADLALAQRIFSSVGMAVILDESLLDAVTGLSGSGPAYIFMIIEALSDAGVKVGLARWDAQALASQTVFGAAKLVIDTQEHPGRLKDMVCSPGGTAISAVHALEEGGLRKTLINAVEVAANRARELGQLKK